MCSVCVCVVCERDVYYTHPVCSTSLSHTTHTHSLSLSRLSHTHYTLSLCITHTHTIHTLTFSVDRRTLRARELSLSYPLSLIPGTEKMLKRFHAVNGSLSHNHRPYLSLSRCQPLFLHTYTHTIPLSLTHAHTIPLSLTHTHTIPLSLIHTHTR